jgi:hypothetical protein
LRLAIYIYDQLEDYRSGIFGLASFFGILRIHLIKHQRRRNAAAHAEHAATDSATFSWTVSAALAWADAATRTASYTAPWTRATRRKTNTGHFVIPFAITGWLVGSEVEPGALGFGFAPG